MPPRQSELSSRPKRSVEPGPRGGRTELVHPLDPGSATPSRMTIKVGEGRALVPPSLDPRPVRLPQLPPQDLARRVARHDIDEIHALGAFERRDPLARPRDDLGGR